MALPDFSWHETPPGRRSTGPDLSIRKTGYIILDCTHIDQIPASVLSVYRTPGFNKVTLPRKRCQYEGAFKQLEQRQGQSSKVGQQSSCAKFLDSFVYESSPRQMNKTMVGRIMVKAMVNIRKYPQKEK